MESYSIRQDHAYLWYSAVDLPIGLLSPAPVDHITPRPFYSCATRGRGTSSGAFCPHLSCYRGTMHLKSYALLYLSTSRTPNFGSCPRTRPPAQFSAIS